MWVRAYKDSYALAVCPYACTDYDFQIIIVYDFALHLPAIIIYFGVINFLTSSSNVFVDLYTFHGDSN